MQYEVLIRYRGQSFYATTKTTTVTVEAETEKSARTKAYANFKKGNRRNVHILGSTVTAVPRSDSLLLGQTYAGRYGNFTLVGEFPTRQGLRYAVERPNGEVKVLSHAQIVEAMQPQRTVEYWALYPTGVTYVNNAPIKSSIYGIDNLVQVKVTKIDGQIVAKEFVG